MLYTPIILEAMKTKLSILLNNLSSKFNVTFIHSMQSDYEIEMDMLLIQQTGMEECLKKFTKNNPFSYEYSNDIVLINKDFKTDSDVIVTNYDETCSILRDIKWALQYIGGNKESGRIIFNFYQNLSEDRKVIFANGISISSVSAMEYSALLKMVTSNRYSSVVTLEYLLHRLILSKRPTCYFSKMIYPGLDKELTTYKVVESPRIEPTNVILFSHLYTMAGGGISYGGTYNGNNSDFKVDTSGGITLLKPDPTTPLKEEKIVYTNNFPNNLQILAEHLTRKSMFKIIISPKISWKPATIVGEQHSPADEIIQAYAQLYNLNFEKAGNTLHLSPYRATLTIQPQQIATEIRRILPPLLIRAIEASVKDGTIHTPSRNFSYQRSIRDLRILIEPLNPSENNRIYIKNCPNTVLDILSTAALSTCFYQIGELISITPLYLKYFPNSFIRIQQDKSSSALRLNYEISYQDETKKTYVLKSEFTYFDHLPAGRK
jgi:hypothetical protein